MSDLQRKIAARRAELAAVADHEKKSASERIAAVQATEKQVAAAKEQADLDEWAKIQATIIAEKLRTKGITEISSRWDYWRASNIRSRVTSARNRQKVTLKKKMFMICGVAALFLLPVVGIPMLLVSAYWIIKKNSIHKKALIHELAEKGVVFPSPRNIFEWQLNLL